MKDVSRSNDFHAKLLIFFSLFSAFVLAASFFAQYVLKIEPCRLCKLQRIPYFFLLCIPLFQIFKMKLRMIRLLTIYTFVLSVILSMYHLLVIGGIVKDFCAVTPVDSIENFMATLDSHVPCSKAEWHFLKIPLAGYNLVFSLVFLFFTLRPLKALFFVFA